MFPLLNKLESKGSKLREFEGNCCLPLSLCLCVINVVIHRYCSLGLFRLNEGQQSYSLLILGKQKEVSALTLIAGHSFVPG